MSDIDLNFGPDSVEPSEFDPICDGVYDFDITGVQTSTTKNNEIMLTLELSVTDELGPVPQYDPQKPVSPGRKVWDRWVIPGAARKEGTLQVEGKSPEQVRKSYHQMMNMLRERLEAVYRTEWRNDGMKLDPSDISGRMVRCAIVIEPYTKNGVTQLSNSVAKYLPAEGHGGPLPDATPQTAGSSFKL